jgi:site-specific DNA-methyltransferase (adenine-specific)
MDIRLYNDDCLNILKDMDENSVDSIVTDPPAGIAFMNKNWDNFAKGKRGINCRKTGSGNPCESEGFAKDVHWGYSNEALVGFQNFIYEVFKKVIRVLKPGGHALVWAIPRTAHHTAMGLERAGFEVRDVIAHVFGTGFPKSLSIGKTVDKLHNNKRKTVLERHRNVKPFDDSAGWNKNNTTGDFKYTKGNSEWEGWGSALKPSYENWLLLKKPLTVVPYGDIIEIDKKIRIKLKI